MQFKDYYGILGVSRTTLAMARDRHLPAPLTAVHPTSRTPYVAEICVGVLVTGIVLVADVREAIGFSSFAVLVYYLVANTAALRLDRERRRLPAWVPVLGAIGCVVVAGSRMVRPFMPASAQARLRRWPRSSGAGAGSMRG